MLRSTNGENDHTSSRLAARSRSEPVTRPATTLKGSSVHVPAATAGSETSTPPSAPITRPPMTPISSTLSSETSAGEKFGAASLMTTPTANGTAMNTINCSFSENVRSSLNSSSLKRRERTRTLAMAAATPILISRLTRIMLGCTGPAAAHFSTGTHRLRRAPWQGCSRSYNYFIHSCRPALLQDASPKADGQRLDESEDELPLDKKSWVNLPKTEFPMKANLPQNEPKMLERWQKMDLYRLIREARHGRPQFVLHDGPPYANGPIHLGTALNKTLKDFVVKTKTMAGFDSPYVPGWDCHGLPIEIKVDEQLGKKKLEMPALAVRKACRAYAEKFVDLQRSQFRRIGVFGQWQDPYLTMSPRYEAAIVEQFYAFFEKGAVYKGLRPVYWCIRDQTALAEAEVEYENHTSPSIYVRYRLTSPPEKIDPALAGKQVSTIIWTTTPWTLPASLAIAFHPDEQYVALAAGHDVFIVAEKLAEQVKEKARLGEAQVVARFAGRKMEYATFAHPFLDRSILGVLAGYVTMDQGTGAVHTAPSHGADDFYTGQKYGLPQTCNVDSAGRMRHGQPEYEGKTVFEANEPI